MLPIVGIANTVLTAKAFGVESGVELFLCPCAMIAGMALRAPERTTMLAILGLAILAFALVQRPGRPAACFLAAGIGAVSFFERLERRRPYGSRCTPIFERFGERRRSSAMSRALRFAFKARRISSAARPRDSRHWRQER